MITGINSKLIYLTVSNHTIEHFLELLQGKMEDELGFMNVELDGRFSAVRTQETNLGKMRQFTND